MLRNLIKDNEVFKNNSRCKQMKVYVQLFLTLRRLGHDDTSNSTDSLSIQFGVGKGTVTLYTRRCLTAIKEELGFLVQWPNEEERASIARSIQRDYFFRDCIYYIDGEVF